MSSFVIDQDLTISAMKGYVSHVFRGLMCFINDPSAQIYYITTRQLVVLPDIEESNIIAEDHKFKKIMYHIGHDPVHDQYKGICTASRGSDEVGEFITHVSEHWVLLLGGDGSNRWRKISSPCLQHAPLTQGLTINGRMHYLAMFHVLYLVLVSFDTSSEEISMVQVPDRQDTFWTCNKTDLIEYGETVAILVISDLKRGGVMKLSVVEDANKNMWSRKTLVLQPSQMNIVNSSLKIQGTTRNGKVILVPQKTTRNPRTGEITN